MYDRYITKQETEDRGQRTDDRGRMTEDARQRTEDRREKPVLSPFGYVQGKLCRRNRRQNRETRESGRNKVFN